MKKLIVLAHDPSPNTRKLADQIVLGARAGAGDDLQVIRHRPLECDAAPAATADAILLFTTENFGYMSGAMKDWFDRCFYNLEDSGGLPWCLCVRAGKDGSGTVRATESICRGLNWKKVQEPLVLRGEYREDFAPQAFEYAQTLAAGLDAGIW